MLERLRKRYTLVEAHWGDHSQTFQYCSDNCPKQKASHQNHKAGANRKTRSGHDTSDGKADRDSPQIRESS
jgi:hypothetical protein